MAQNIDDLALDMSELSSNFLQAETDQPMDSESVKLRESVASQISTATN